MTIQQKVLKRNNLFIWLILLLFLGSCRKKEVTVRVSGVVNNSVLQQGVSNLQIKLLVKEVQSGTYSNTFKLLQTTTTDLNGNYSFEFPHRTALEYKIQIESDLFFVYSEIINPDDWSLTEMNKYDIYLSPKSYIKLRVKNQFPQSATDNVVVISNNNNCQLCFNPGLMSFNGTQTDTLVFGATLGMNFWNYTYVVTKNSMTYNYADSAYCFAGDTVFVNILY
jgi:hypothetical protein